MLWLHQKAGTLNVRERDCTGWLTKNTKRLQLTSSTWRLEGKEPFCVWRTSRCTQIFWQLDIKVTTWTAEDWNISNIVFGGFVPKSFCELHSCSRGVSSFATQSWICKVVRTWTRGLFARPWVRRGSARLPLAAPSLQWWPTVLASVAHRASSAWRHGAFASPCRSSSSSLMPPASIAAFRFPGRTSRLRALPSPPSCESPSASVNMAVHLFQQKVIFEVKVAHGR